MVQTYQITTQAQPAGDIVLTPGSVSETAFENEAAATLSVSGGADGDWHYEILDDSSGGAFRIEGDRLVVADNARLDFETAPEVIVTIRATDSSGQSLTETMTIAVTDEAIERRYSTGDEFMATETDDEWDSGSILVPLAGGGFALIWHRVVDFSTNDHAAVVRYFDADGAPASDEIVLVSGEMLRNLSATPTAEGGFLLTRITDPDPVTGMSNVRAQAYDDAGNPVAPLIIAEGGDFPVAVQLGTGGYVIASIRGNGEIYAERFTSAGAPSGPDILVGTAFPFEPFDLTATADGGFAVAWVQHGNTGNDPRQVKARFFDSSGAPSGTPVAVVAEGLPESPTLVALADGSYVLGWADLTGHSEHGAFIKLKAVPIGADGLAAGPPVTLATYKAEAQFGPVPSFAAHPDGGFVAMWPNAERGWNDTVYHRFNARQFDSSGAPIGPEFQPTEFADGGGLAVLADGTIATAWYHSESFGQGVSARVYRPADATDPPDSPWGTPGNDIIYGGEGADWVNGRGGDDQLYGLGGDDELLGRTGNDRLSGGAGNDLLRGGDGNDVLDGGSGEDWLRGGAGNDLYIVDSAGDRVFEDCDAGTDEIRTALASYSLAALPDVENLTAASNDAHDFRGNSGSNVITGGGGADLLRLNDGGDDIAYGGDGNDVFYFGGALRSADKVDGGAGRDTIVLQENVNVVLSNTSLVNVESISLQSGANPKFGDTTNNFYDFNLTMADGNVAAGQQLIVNGQSLRAGEDLTFNGSAESDGKYLIYAGHGVDTLKGGSGNDIFFFEGNRWGAGDRVDGGGGRDSVVIAAGNGLNRFVFGTASFANIESISVNNRLASDPTTKPSYELVLHNNNVAPGGTLIVNGNSLTDPNQQVNFDGRAVMGGNLNLFGGAGHDALVGGAGADLLHGGSGADQLSGGGGADIFRYDAASESVAGASDTIGDFQSGLDRIDLSRIDANTHSAGNQAFRWIGSNAFTGTGAASAGELRVIASGGYQRVEGDTNGDGLADLVIVVNATAPLTHGDFLP